MNNGKRKKIGTMSFSFFFIFLFLELFRFFFIAGAVALGYMFGACKYHR